MKDSTLLSVLSTKTKLNQFIEAALYLKSHLKRLAEKVGWLCIRGAMQSVVNLPIMQINCQFMSWPLYKSTPGELLHLLILTHLVLLILIPTTSYLRSPPPPPAPSSSNATLRCYDTYQWHFCFELCMITFGINWNWVMCPENNVGMRSLNKLTYFEEKLPLSKAILSVINYISHLERAAGNTNNEHYEPFCSEIFAEIFGWNQNSKFVIESCVTVWPLAFLPS